MGRLIEKTSIPNDDLSWYLCDGYYSSTDRRYIYKWPNSNYPFFTAIHRDRLDDIKIKIRQWVEKYCSSTVIHADLNKSYRVYLTNECSWDRSYEKSNVWVQFYFEDEEDLTAFSLAFCDYIQPITDLHPEETTEYEKTSYNKNY